MLTYIITHPTATLAGKIEDLMCLSDNSNFLVKNLSHQTAGLCSAVVFPIFLTIELLFKKIPLALWHWRTDQWGKHSDEALKYLLAIPASMIFGLYYPDGVPGFFLERKSDDYQVSPFGVEEIYGKRLSGSPILRPKTVDMVRDIVRAAKTNQLQVSILGAGMSQGTQTVPKKSNNGCVIDLFHLNEIQIDTENNLLTVGAGATWEKVQLALDQVDKATIVKQASDIFSIGGSIGINCHGWAHTVGSISKTVRSMKIIDANGNLRTLHKPRENVPLRQLTEEEQLFKCMFGTMGYFGIVVEVTFDITDNEMVIETTKEVKRDDFFRAYERIDKTKTKLFGGRLTLDNLSGDPLRSICMVEYRSINKPLNRRITAEPEKGTRVQRIALKLISHLPDSIVKRLITAFWEYEKKSMFSAKIMSRNEALHPPINSFQMFHESKRHAQWLQEYFIEKERLPNFLRFLGAELKANQVRVINATIRPTPQDPISILPYAEKERYAVVISFAQIKSEKEIAKTRKWIENINAYLAAEKGVFYQAYMPYATKEQFEICYGKDNIGRMRWLKKKFDPQGVFGNGHTAKYYDSGFPHQQLPQVRRELQKPYERRPLSKTAQALDLAGA